MKNSYKEKQVLAENLLRHLGLKRMTTLTENLGGQRVYLPHSLPPDHTLREVLDNHACQILCEKFGGERIEIPQGRILAKLQHKAKIEKWSKEGKSSAWIAKRLGLSNRWIRELKKELRQEGRLIEPKNL